MFDLVEEARAQAASGALREALTALMRLRAEHPNSSRAEFEIGELLSQLGLHATAVEAYNRCINLDPTDPLVSERLSSAYRALSYQGRSAQYASRAARLRCFDHQSLGALAQAQSKTGRVESSLRSYRRALTLDPSNFRLHSDYLFTLLHSTRPSAAEIKAAHEEWIKLHCKPEPSAPQFLNSPDPDRKLRIGYVCQDLRFTPDLHFLMPVLRNHDRRHVEVYIFHVMPEHDKVTGEYRGQVDIWRDVSTLSPIQITQQIRLDKIDVLVERSGHLTSHAGIAVFARRSAPVQAAYLDYPSTTGCGEIDYLISDRWTTPESAYASEYSERNLYDLPNGTFLYAPPPDLPNIPKLPVRGNGFLTFGLFQRPAKLNEQVWNTVAAILHRVPHSRLLIQHADAELQEPGGYVRGRILRELHRRAIREDRVSFIGVRGWPEYFDVLASVDIALDTFPYSGTTTTCACLWMGVPVVTFSGDRHSSRVSGAILSRMGMEDWVAHSLDEYVDIAVSKASNIEALAAVRAGLRERMANSSVCRPEIVVRELEEAYRWMWRQWCASQTTSQPQTMSAASP